MADDNPVVPPVSDSGHGDTPLTSQEVKNLLARLDSRDAELEGVKGRIETLQDALDSALEELALKGGPPEAELEVEPEEPGSPEPAARPESLKDEVPPAELGLPDIESEIEKSIAEDKRFRDEILLREETRDLSDELNIALGAHPEADRDEVLRAIEDGAFEDEFNQVELLAIASESRLALEKESLTETVKELLKQQAKTEAEGGISVPQSSVPPTSSPRTPEPSRPAKPFESEDAVWGDALEKAKAEVREE